MKEEIINKYRNSGINIYQLRNDNDFPPWIDRNALAEFLYKSLKPFEDPLPEVKNGIDYALSSTEVRNGFILLAGRNKQPVGSVVMLKTNMSGYVPDYLLLFVAVKPQERGKGIGGRIIREAIEFAEGDVSLHVEYDNPAKRLYERLGFVNKYADMRYLKREVKG